MSYCSRRILRFDTCYTKCTTHPNVDILNFHVVVSGFRCSLDIVGVKLVLTISELYSLCILVFIMSSMVTEWSNLAWYGASYAKLGRKALGCQAGE
jgi:hypothetical protein